MAKISLKNKELTVSLSPEEFMNGEVNEPVAKGYVALQYIVRNNLKETKYADIINKAKAVKIWFSNGQFHLTYLESL